MEIIQERLEREYNLDLITTAPSVVYHNTKTDGTKLSIDNPTNYPDPSTLHWRRSRLRTRTFTPRQNLWVTSWSFVRTDAVFSRI